MNDYRNTRDYFNKRALNWDNEVKHNNKKIELILEVTNLKENSKILDVGTGTGVLINSLEKFNPNWIYALDISPAMISQAKKKFQQKSLTFIVENFYDCNLKGIDYLICYSGYPHFLDKKEFSNKVYDILKTSGRFVIAHSQNKVHINEVHSDKKTSQVSNKLNSAFKEAEIFMNDFNIDVIIDTDELFVISGIKK